METKLKDLFATMIRETADAISGDSTPSDFPAWDSMQHLIMIGSVEEEFGVVIDPDEIVDMYENYGNFERVVVTKLRS